MPRLIRIAFLTALAALPTFALAPFNISCQKGGQKVQTSSIPSTNTVQQSFPGATVTVYIHGGASGIVSTSGTSVTWVSGTQFNANSDWNSLAITIASVPYVISTVVDTTHLTLTASAGTQTSVAYSAANARAPIFSDYSGGTPQPNPLTCNATAGFLVYSPNSIIDETFSGTGIAAPFTLSSVASIDPASTTTGLITYNASLGTAAAQCTAAYNNNQTLIVAQVMARLSTQAMLCSMLILKGGLIQPASGQTVTLLQNTQCPLTQQCYDISLGGTVSFTSPPAQLSPIQWGADVTGAVSAVSAINASLVAAVGSGNAGTLNMPAATYNIDSTITTPSAFGLIVQGAGIGTNLHWTGNNSGATSLLIPNCSECQFKNFYMTFANAANAAIQTENADAMAHTATQDVFSGIHVESGATAGTSNINVCFLIDGPIDANNDQQRFVDSHCNGAGVAGWQLGNASGGFNVFNIVMDHCSYLFSGFGSYGVWLRHGNFHWTNGDGAGAYLADFKIDTEPSGTIEIDNAEFENSKQFIVTLASGGLSSPINVHDVAWDGACLGQTQAQIKTNCPGGPVASDMMTLQYNGPWHFWNNRIGASASQVLATIALNLDSASFPSVYEFRNNVFGTTGIDSASGTVTTSGTAVTWVSGTPFSATAQWAGQTITIAGSPYTIMACASAMACTLTGSAGTHATPVAYSMVQTVWSTHPPTLTLGNLLYCHDCTAPTRMTDAQNLAMNFTGIVNFTGPVTQSLAPQTYSPALAFGAVSTGITYGTDAGVYWSEVGGFTTVRVTLVLTSKGSATGTATISMPTTSVGGGYGTCLLSANGSGVVTIVPFVLATDNKLTLLTQGSAGSAALQDTNFSNTTSIFCYARYN